MVEIISKSVSDTKKAASELAEYMRNNNLRIVSLKGSLGAGKTVFVKGFCGECGVDEYTVKSPTYTYMRKYENEKGDIYHFDYYRLDEPDETVFEELSEIMASCGAKLLIEWPEKISRVLPENKIEVIIDHGETENERIIKIIKP